MISLPPFSLRESRIIEDAQCLRCSKCRDWKPLNQFGATKHTRSGKQSHCKACKNAFMEAYNAKVWAKKVKKRTEMTQDAPRKSKVKRVEKLSKTLLNPKKRQRKAIKPVSDKRKVQNKLYTKVRAKYLEVHPYCMVCFRSASNQIHHKRGKEGSWLTDISEFLAVCPECHERIETNREWAAQQGYLKLRLTSDQISESNT